MERFLIRSPCRVISSSVIIRVFVHIALELIPYTRSGDCGLPATFIDSNQSVAAMILQKKKVKSAFLGKYGASGAGNVVYLECGARLILPRLLECELPPMNSYIAHPKGVNSTTRELNYRDKHV